MTTMYLICACAGGAIFLIQLLLSIFGGDSGHDFSHDSIGGDVVDHEAHFWGVFSVRAIIAGVTAFGLGGLLAQSMGASTLISMPIAGVFFFIAALLVAMLFKFLTKLTADGTARIEKTVGTSGTVYISIPAEKQGVGKVTLLLQNRTVELEAMTYGNKLETGTRVVVTSVIAPGTVEVIAVPEMSSEYQAHPVKVG